MAMKVKWADVALGNDLRTYHIGGDDGVEEITVDEHTLGLTVQVGDGSIMAYVGCSYVLCMEDVAEIITPKIEIAS